MAKSGSAFRRDDGRAAGNDCGDRRQKSDVDIKASPPDSTNRKRFVATREADFIFRAAMLSEDSFHYAIENTRVIRAPEQRIATFGSTSFRFYLVTELMDTVQQVRVRDGRLHAERPQILTPGLIQQTLLEGFGERAEEFIHWLQENSRDLAILKYGFQLRKTDVTENLVHSPIEDVIGRLGETLDASDEPLSAIIQGVDEGWEVCLLKFASDLIQNSAGRNVDDFRKRGLF